jgi:hypothetical protein
LERGGKVAGGNEGAESSEDGRVRTGFNDAVGGKGRGEGDELGVREGSGAAREVDEGVDGEDVIGARVGGAKEGEDGVEAVTGEGRGPRAARIAVGADGVAEATFEGLRSD